MLFILILIIQTVFSQLPSQPTVTTSSACLNGCLQEGSVVYAANNLRNFEKIVLFVDQFCNAFNTLVKCAESCNEQEQQDLADQISLSEYICIEKLEEFRLIKDCVQNEEVNLVNKCANDCGFQKDATIQLDSSPSAAINPFAFFDSITPVCRTTECLMKCSINEWNKKCAASGDILRDIGLKQVLEASERLHNDMFNSSSSVAQELAKIYLDALPDQCAYITDPIKYDLVFAASDDESAHSEAVTVINLNGKMPFLAEELPINAENEKESSITQATAATNVDQVITRIFDVKIPTEFTNKMIETTTSGDISEESEQTSSDQTNIPAEDNVENEEAKLVINTDTKEGNGHQQSSTNDGDQQEISFLDSQTKNISTEIDGNKSDNDRVQTTKTIATTPEIERTIMVVNDENDHEIERNRVDDHNGHNQHHFQHDKNDLSKAALGDGGTISTLLFSILLLRYFLLY